MYLDYSSTGETARPGSVTLPKGTSFNATVDSKTYTFKTRDVLIARDDGNGLYYFALNNDTNVPVYEGSARTKTFIAGPASENDSYVIPETKIDLDTVEVRVYNSVTSTAYDAYTNLNTTTNISATSRIFVVKETPNGFYEVTFSNGSRLGLSPESGQRIEVLYDVVAGPDANGARTFTTNTQVNGKSLNITTTTLSSGGALKEGIESIRKNAPYQYAAQNRAVTAEDYSALVLREFGNNVSDVKTWGGQDNIPPRYGVVYMSLVFNTTDPSVIQDTKDNIRDLFKDLAVISFDVDFIDPIETYIEAQVFFQFNPNLTSVTQSVIENRVSTSVQSFFNTNLGDFDQSFRRSNLLTEIDDVDPSVLSSRATIKMQNRFVPVVGSGNYTVTYPTSLAAADDKVYIIESDNFRYKGDICYLRNRLNSTILEVYNVSTGQLAVDNIGSYDPTTGVLNLENFTISLLGGDYVKITALPANQSTITPLRNNILRYDAEESSANAVLSASL